LQSNQSAKRELGVSKVAAKKGIASSSFFKGIAENKSVIEESPN